SEASQAHQDGSFRTTQQILQERGHSRGIRFYQTSRLHAVSRRSLENTAILEELEKSTISEVNYERMRHTYSTEVLLQKKDWHLEERGAWGGLPLVTELQGSFRVPLRQSQLHIDRKHQPDTLASISGLGITEYRLRET